MPSARLDRAGLFGLCAAAFLSMAAMRACDPLLPAFAESFGVSMGEAAQTISGFAIAYGLLQLAFGPLADRYGKFRVVACAVTACALGNLLALIAADLQMLVWARVLSGATAGAIVPLSLAWVGDAVNYERRQEVLAQLMGATLLGTAFGQWISGVLADTVGWRVVLGLLAFLFVLLGTRLLWMARSRPPPVADAQVPNFVRGLVNVLREPWARRILIVVAIEGAFAFSAMVFMPAFLHADFGLSLQHAALITALFAISGLAYAFSARRLLARLGERGLVLWGAGLLGGSFVVLALLDDWRLAIPICLLAGLGFTMLHSTLQTHATQMAPATRGTAVSLFGACLFFGQSLGVLLAALLVDEIGFRAVFLLSAVALLLLGAEFARALARRTPV